MSHAQMGQITKKPIPVSHDAWQREVDGIRRFQEKAARYRRDNGTDWTNTMLRYYDQRLADLKANEPPKTRPAKVKRKRGRFNRG